MPLGSYKKLEADQPPDCWDVPDVDLDGLQTHEACMLMRKREGLTLDDLADKIELTKWWLCLMEQGKAPIASLLKYWSS
jgi:hypothetical protein